MKIDCYKNILKELFTISPGFNLHKKKKLVKNKINFYLIKKNLRIIILKSLRKNYEDGFYSPFSSTFIDFSLCFKFLALPY